MAPSRDPALVDVKFDYLHASLPRNWVCLFPLLGQILKRCVDVILPPPSSPVILGVANTVAPIAYWGSFFVVVFLAFSITLNAIASGFSALDYGTIYWAMNTLFLGTFGQGNGMDDITNSKDALAMIVYLMYMVVVPLILFNILIAMVT